MELCARCEMPATDEVFCAEHYEEYLGEWACLCGWMNDHDDTNCWQCGQTPA